MPIDSYFKQDYDQTANPAVSIIETPTGRLIAIGEGELRHSENQGDDWVPFAASDPFGFDRNDINSLFVLSGGRIIAGSDDLYNSPPYYSDDDGETWAAADASAIGGHVRDILELDSGRLIAAVGDAWDEVAGNNTYLAKSDDNGETWTSSGGNVGSTSSRFTRLTLLANGRILAVGRTPIINDPVNAIYSDDDGDTWDPVPGLDTTLDYVEAFYLPGEGRTLVLAKQSGVTVYESTDNGDSWSELSNFALSYGDLVRGIIAEGPYLVVAFQNTAIAESADSGASWTVTYNDTNNLINTNYGTGDIDMFPSGRSAVLLSSGGRLLFTEADYPDFLIAASSDLVPLSPGGGGDPAPPPPWWTAKEGVTEVRRA